MECKNGMLEYPAPGDKNIPFLQLRSYLRLANCDFGMASAILIQASVVIP